MEKTLEDIQRVTLEDIREEKVALNEIQGERVALEEAREEKVMLEGIQGDIFALVERAEDNIEMKADIQENIIAIENEIEKHIGLLGDKIDYKRIALEDKIEKYFLNSNMTVTIIGTMNMVNSYTEVVLERTIRNGKIHYSLTSEEGLILLEKDEVVSIEEIKYVLGDREYILMLKNGLVLQYSKA